MDVQKAYSIIGHANACEPYLANMIRALQSMPWLNTAADNERLQAAIWVRIHRREYRAYCQAKLDRKA